jgi:cytochrome c oxidase subunit 2
MALTVVAEPPARFAAWQASQRAVAATPGDPATLAAQRAFLASGCTLCHQVRGTDARGELGPDLTHVGSRLTLAAGTLPNTPGNLYGWIADPQAHKPGNKMPPLPLAAAELHLIARYLSTLR